MPWPRNNATTKTTLDKKPTNIQPVRAWRPGNPLLARVEFMLQFLEWKREAHRLMAMCHPASQACAG